MWSLDSVSKTDIDIIGSIQDRYRYIGTDIVVRKDRGPGRGSGGRRGAYSRASAAPRFFLKMCIININFLHQSCIFFIK